LALCALSVMWSPFPAATLRRTVTMSICWMFGTYCFIVFGLENTLRLFAKTSVVLALLSVFAYVAVPSVGYETAEGYGTAMRGVFSQKNNLGTEMVLGISCLLYVAMRQGGLGRVGVQLAVLLMLGCIIMSQSATSLLVAVLIIFAALGMTLAQSLGAPLVTFAVGILILLTAYIITFAPE